MATSLRRGLSFAGAQRCSVLASARRFLSPSDAWFKSSPANSESFRAFQKNTSVEGLLFTHLLVLQHKKALARLDMENQFLSSQKWENPLIGWTSTGDSYANVGDAGLSFDGEKAGKAFTEGHGWKYVVTHFEDN